VTQPLLHDLSSQVSEALTAALGVELAGGTSAAWEAILTRCGVAAMSEDDRYPEAKRARMYRGAPIPEVKACLERIAAEAIRAAPPGESAHVQEFVSRFVPDALARYEEIAREKPKGGMFAHALASAREHRYAEHRTTRGYVLECPRCGAPRLSGFVCDYCGAHLSGKEEEG